MSWGCVLATLTCRLRQRYRSLHRRRCRRRRRRHCCRRRRRARCMRRRRLRAIGLGEYEGVERAQAPLGGHVLCGLSVLRAVRRREDERAPRKAPGERQSGGTRVHRALSLTRLRTVPKAGPHAASTAATSEWVFQRAASCRGVSPCSPGKQRRRMVTRETPLKRGSGSEHADQSALAGREGEGGRAASFNLTLAHCALVIVNAGACTWRGMGVARSGRARRGERRRPAAPLRSRASWRSRQSAVACSRAARPWH